MQYNKINLRYINYHYLVKRFNPKEIFIPKHYHTENPLFYGHPYHNIYKRSAAPQKGASRYQRGKQSARGKSDAKGKSDHHSGYGDHSGYGHSGSGYGHSGHSGYGHSGHSGYGHSGKTH